MSKWFNPLTSDPQVWTRRGRCSPAPRLTRGWTPLTPCLWTSFTQTWTVSDRYEAESRLTLFYLPSLFYHFEAILLLNHKHISNLYPFILLNVFQFLFYSLECRLCFVSDLNSFISCCFVFCIESERPRVFMVLNILTSSCGRLVPFTIRCWCLISLLKPPCVMISAHVITENVTQVCVNMNVWLCFCVQRLDWEELTDILITTLTEGRTSQAVPKPSSQVT